MSLKIKVNITFVLLSFFFCDMNGFLSFQIYHIKQCSLVKSTNMKTSINNQVTDIFIWPLNIYQVAKYTTIVGGPICHNGKHFWYI